MKVLIVDDSRVMRQIVQRTLRQAGYTDLELMEAANGLEAYQLAVQHGPDLVLSDWNMPEMNGIDLLRSLRGMGDAVPFGFVTSESTQEMRQKAQDAGALFLVVKPFTAEQLVAVVNKVVR